jgi:phytoene desaturase
MADYDVIVIGAGCGGTTAAALLAHQGRSTLLLEQSDRIGGCCSTFERDGFKFDLGATILEIIQPLESVFGELGTTLQAEIDLIPIDPIMSILFPDGERVTYPLSVEQTGEMIRSISPDDGLRWPDYVAFCQKLMEVALDTFFVMPANDLSDMLATGKKNPRLLKLLPVFMSSYEDIIRKFFQHERVLQTLGRQAYYFGLPPALAPGLFAMIPYAEHCGVYYPRGGMIQIPSAIQRVGERFGLETRLGMKVDEILVQDRRAIGVRLADETEITSSLVVSNINARYLYSELIGLEHLPRLARRGIQSYNYSVSVSMIYVGLDYTPPLASHNSMIAVSPEEMNRYWWENVKPGILPRQPFGLICWPTHSDPSLAPKKKHVLNLITEGFYHLRDTDWDREKSAYIERSLGYFDKFIPGLVEHAQVVECSTPLDFERRLNLPEGALYSLQQDLPAMSVFRSSAKSKSIQGLYLVGSYTHPGGSVPATIASGRIAAHLIERYEA